MTPIMPRMTGYRESIAALSRAALAVGVTLGALDTLLTLRRTHFVAVRGALELSLVTLTLYATASLVVGVVEGVVSGAVVKTLPSGFFARLWRRLREDAAFDREVFAWEAASSISLALYATAVAALGMALVARTERKLVGAILSGAGAAALLPAAVLLAFPLYRVARSSLRWLPRSERVPSALLGPVLAGFGGALWGADFVATRLDWRELDLGGFFLVATFGTLQLGYFLLRPWLPQGSSWRAAGRVAVWTGWLLAAAGPLVVLWHRPTPRVQALLTEEGFGAPALVRFARRLGDRDHDGWSRFLGGGDCDDTRADVHPGARDVPDDGIDQNCIGGDAHRGELGRSAEGGMGPGADGAFRFEHANLLFIVIDAMRADRMGASGYRPEGRSLTPNLDALAERGVWFRQARAQAPNTPRSLPSILGSRLPSQIAWENPFANFPRPKTSEQNLFHYLGREGYATIGVASHFYFRTDYAGTAGFTEFDNEGALDPEPARDDVAGERIATRAVRRLSELAKSGQRFAMLVHLFDAHSRYVEHPQTPHQGATFVDRYDGEVAYADQQVGRIVAELSASGLTERTLLVVASDHGETFGEHRAGGQAVFYHGTALYEELLRVPLLISAPRVVARSIDTPIAMLELAPTLTDVLLGKVPARFAGHSLAAALNGGPVTPRASFAELLPSPAWPHAARAWIDERGAMKVLHKETENLFELYDLASDPQETVNLVESRSEATERAFRAYAAWVDSLD